MSWAASRQVHFKVWFKSYWPTFRTIHTYVEGILARVFHWEAFISGCFCEPKQMAPQDPRRIKVMWCYRPLAVTSLWCWVDFKKKKILQLDKLNQRKHQFCLTILVDLFHILFFWSQRDQIFIPAKVKVLWRICESHFWKETLILAQSSTL